MVTYSNVCLWACIDVATLMDGDYDCLLVECYCLLLPLYIVLRDLCASALDVLRFMFLTLALCTCRVVKLLGLAFFFYWNLRFSTAIFSSKLRYLFVVNLFFGLAVFV